MDKPQIFISHTGSDRPWVREVAQALRTQGVSAWLDEDEVRPGDDLRAALEAALRESDVIAFVLNPQNVESPWMYFELGAAVGMGKRIVPIVPEGFELGQLPISLRARRFLRKGPPEQTARELAEAVCVPPKA